MTTPSPSDQVRDLREELHTAGLRATSSRIAVLKLLRQSTSPVSHGEVTEQLQNEGYDRATLYRNLFDLNRVGLARRTDLGDHVWRFEATLPGGHATEEHPHFVCNQCGGVECLEGVEVVLQRGAKGPRAIKKKAVEIQLKGLCDRCTAALPLAGHRYSIEAFAAYIIVRQEGTLDSPISMRKMQGEIDQTCKTRGVTRVLFDNRHTGVHGDEIRAGMWAWVKGAGFSRIALLLESEMAVVRANMDALSRRTHLRAFSREPDAVAWLRETR